MQSYSVRCVYRWLGAPSEGLHTYEERITLWKASTIDEAIAMAEAEATCYAAESECEYLGYCQAYAMVRELDADSIEVFSLLRDSPLAPSEYIDRFFSTGQERERAV